MCSHDQISEIDKTAEPIDVNMRESLTIEDLRRRAQRRVPRMFYDYVEAGSWSESTRDANIADLADIVFRQRVAVDISTRDLTANMLGQEFSLPIGLAPVGLTGMQYPDGEIHSAQAAKAAGIPYVLSSMSVCSIEDVASTVRSPFWFQLYVMRDRGFTEGLISRAEAAGCKVLVLTLDLPIMGQRHADIRNGLGSKGISVRNLLNVATKPQWLAGILRTKRRSLGNLVGHVDGVDDAASLREWVGKQFDPSLDWDDVAAFRARWPGKLVLKGILDEDDARQAADIGADAIIVSNHGGRQLDGAPSSISVLPSIVAAVGNRVEVYVDGGIRSGQDVLKALSLGARAVFVGRAYTYGLGAGGRAGVDRAIEILKNELDQSMALTGNLSARRIDSKTIFARGHRA